MYTGQAVFTYSPCVIVSPASMPPPVKIIGSTTSASVHNTSMAPTASLVCQSVYVNYFSLVLL